MRVAPPVQALSCGAGPWQSVQQALYALAVAVVAWWAGSHLWGATPWVGLGGLLLGLTSPAVAGRALPVAPQRLVWDGAVWQLQPARGERLGGRASLMLDLGGWMLVRFVPAGVSLPVWRAARWLPLSRRDAAADWQPLRVALHAPQPTA